MSSDFNTDFKVKWMMVLGGKTRFLGHFMRPFFSLATEIVHKGVGLTKLGV